MWKTQNREDFEQVVGDMLADPYVQALADKEQHGKLCSRLDHSIYVAYLSFLVCRRLGFDYVAAARGGLLHDFHFGDKEEGASRVWKHPHAALQNAESRYALSDKERDIIVKHMWPLTRPLPRCKESFVVSLTDKFCALMEFSYLYKLMRVRKKLHENMLPQVA